MQDATPPSVGAMQRMDADILLAAVQSQLDAVLDGQDIEHQNPNAMAMVEGFLAVAAEKAEVVGDGDLGGQARDLRERIAASRACEVAAG